MSLKEFVARQLNDHCESPSGVKQDTYTEWTEEHISQALEMGMCYLYSLVPQEFSELKTYTVREQTCIVDLSSVCDRFTGLANLTIGDTLCVDLNQEEESEDESIDLLDLFSGPCSVADNESSENEDQDEELEYNWNIVDGSNNILKFDPSVPAGAIISYLCAPTPSSEDVDDNALCQYSSLIADFALWWLYRTDTESRSNLARAEMHFQAIQFYVQTKLNIEFSLKEDDYAYTIRKVES